MAHASRLSGHSVVIFSKKQRSPMRGAQYQHVAIPGIPDSRSSKLRYALIGTVDGYREKVYAARNPDIVVSPSEYEGVHDCWDLRHAYDHLWHQFGRNVIDTMVSPELLSRLHDTFDVVFSTIPAPLICEDRQHHRFKHVNVWIDGCWSGPMQFEERRLWRGVQHLVICNGMMPIKRSLERTGWYRSSNIFDSVNTEWASQDTIPQRHNKPGMVFTIRKPLTTNCTCWPSVVRAGRYGLWRKGVLTHHAFQEALDTLEYGRSQSLP
jgi:hypothetical protein